MTAAPDDEFVVRRVLIALSPSTASHSALDSAVEVAARLGAELEALFVEDLNLLALADLPFVREVSLHGVASRPVQRAAIERQVRALAAKVQRQLSEAALRRQIHLSFRVTRGHLLAAIGAAAVRSDLLILEAMSRPLARERRLELAERQLVAGTTRSVLLLHPERAPGGPVHVALEAGRSVRAWRAARALAARYASPLVATVVGSDSELERMLDQAAGQPASAAFSLERRTMSAMGPATLDQLLAGVAHGTLVVNVASPLLGAEAAWERLARAPCTVLLVR